MNLDLVGWSEVTRSCSGTRAVEFLLHEEECVVDGRLDDNRGVLGVNSFVGGGE